MGREIANEDNINCFKTVPNKLGLVTKNPAQQPPSPSNTKVR